MTHDGGALARDEFGLDRSELRNAIEAGKRTADTAPSSTSPAAHAAAGAQRRRSAPLAERLLTRLLSGLQAGSLSIETPGGAKIEHRGRLPGPHADIALASWRPLWRLLVEGDIGLAHGYLAGEWRSRDLKTLLEFGARNESALAATAGWSLAALLDRLRHRGRVNTRRGSRRNVSAHYDLGNAFYAQWLDSGMNYSSGIFSAPTQTLEAAQDAKLDRIVAMLDVPDGARVLEIGCGWGALAQRLLDTRNCSLTALTLSHQQLAYTQARLRQRLASAHGAREPGRIDALLQDYRDVKGHFDRIVSIEMLEAVGEEFWPTYFDTLRRRLTPGGAVVLQAITIEESRYDTYRRRPDFIQRHIFPGGMLPTAAMIRRQAESAGFTLVQHEAFGRSYARTLAEWRRRFGEAWSRIEAQGYDQRFRRTWDYYLAYCEVGFLAGAIDVGLYRLVRR